SRTRAGYGKRSWRYRSSSFARHCASYSSASANSCSMRALSAASSPAGCSPAIVLRRVATKPTTTRGTTTTAKMIHGIMRAAYLAPRDPATCPMVSAMPEPESDQLTATQRAALEAELEELEGPRRRAVVQAIKTAREHGDLSENFEYHAAKNE